MGYRDDELAFKIRRDDLDREVSELVSLRDDLTGQEADLRAELRRRRVRLVFVKLGRWAARHPVWTLLFAGILTLTIYTQIRIAKERRIHEQLIADVLGRNCKTSLEVTARPGGTVFVNGLRLGRAPISRQICPGRYLVRVTSNRSIAWQRRVLVDAQPRIGLRARLLPLAGRSPEMMVVHSIPSSAVVFVEGKELGQAPVLVRRRLFVKPSQGKRRLQIGLWAPGHQPRVQRVRAAADVWFHLAPETVSRASTQSEGVR